MNSKVCIGDIVESVSERFDFVSQASKVLINTSDVLSGEVLNHSVVSDEQVKGQFKKAFKTNDILYSEIRPANMRFAFIDFDSTNYVASTKLMVLRTRSELIRPKYLYAYLTSHRVIEYLQNIAESRSGTFPQITFDEISRLQLSLPPINVQDNVISVLNLFDQKIKVNCQINDYLVERYLHLKRQSLLTLALAAAHRVVQQA